MPSLSSTNFVTAIDSPESVRVPKLTVPEAVTFTAPVIDPEAISIVPSLNLPAVTLPLAVTVVAPLKAPLLNVAVPSVSEPPVTAPVVVYAPALTVSEPKSH